MTLVEEIKKTVEEGKEKLKDIEIAVKIMEKAHEPVSEEKKAIEEVKARLKRIEEAMPKE